MKLGMSECSCGIVSFHGKVGIQAISRVSSKHINSLGRSAEYISLRTGQMRGTQPTKHAPHALIPEPRRSQVCNCPPHSAALCAALNVSCSVFTILDNKKKENRSVNRETMMWRGEHTMNGERHLRCLRVTTTQFAHYERASVK
jgi:hypothetical protein